MKLDISALDMAILRLVALDISAGTPGFLEEARCLRDRLQERLTE